jgi:ABC-type nitrate/sulfonate/bicarbonate transport system substrate-binding protein
LKARQITWRAVAAAIAMTMSACSAASTDSAGGGANVAGPTVHLAVGVDPSFAPIFLADEKGLFKKQGVNVDVVQFGKGGDAVDAIASGQVQMAGSSDTTTIGQLQQNPGLRALLVYEQSGRYLKVVERKSIGDPSQIKKMAVVPGLSELAATRFLESKKIDPKTVAFVTADPPEIPALMQKGEVDAYVLWEPWPAKGAQLGGKIVETTGDYGLSYVHWLISGNTWLSANAGTAAKVAKALDEATRMTESDPQAAAQATQKAAKVPAAQTVAAIKEIDYGVRDITAADMKGYEATADFFLRTGKVKAKPDVGPVVLQNWFSEHAEK